MKNLKNWDKKNWLSSDEYISSLTHFLENKINFNKEIRILDIGCGSGKIISTFSKKYEIKNLPIGIDVVKQKDTAKKIKFIKINALKYLVNTKKNLILLYLSSLFIFLNLTKLKKY